MISVSVPLKAAMICIKKNREKEIGNNNDNDDHNSN